VRNRASGSVPTTNSQTYAPPERAVETETAMLSDRPGPEPTVIRAADGSLVVYIELGPVGGSDLGQLIADARSSGIDSIWLKGHLTDSSLGFERVGGYARLETTRPLMRIELPTPPPDQIRALRITCFEGVWGHPEPANIDPSTTFVGLPEAAGWIGICEVDTERRRIVAPAVRRGLHTPPRYARLVCGASQRLGTGPISLESCGDDEDTLAAYKALGFSLVEYTPGWQLNLKARPDRG
jgi:hypothetical protein